MKWLNVSPHGAMNEEGTAGIGRHGSGDWFFVALGETPVEGFATRDDAIDAAEAHLAKCRQAVSA